MTFWNYFSFNFLDFYPCFMSISSYSTTSRFVVGCVNSTRESEKSSQSVFHSPCFFIVSLYVLLSVCVWLVFYLPNWQNWFGFWGFWFLKMRRKRLKSVGLNSIYGWLNMKSFKKMSVVFFKYFCSSEGTINTTRSLIDSRGNIRER